MKFSLISDMHVNHPQPKTEYDKLEKLVVVAGDTSNGLEGLKFLQKIKNKGHDVFAVDGNHEHYSNVSQRRTAEETVAAFVDTVSPWFGGVLQRLDEGLGIVGTNGWYTVSDEPLWLGYMNDGRYAGLNADAVNKMAEAAADNIDKYLSSHDRAIVVTHTAPCEESLNPEYAGYFSNEWYWNPFFRPLLSKHRDKIAVWCHGHTHARADVDVDGVRIVANPRGYPGENPNWEPLTVEV